MILNFVYLIRLKRRLYCARVVLFPKILRDTNKQCWMTRILSSEWNYTLSLFQKSTLSSWISRYNFEYICLKTKSVDQFHYDFNINISSVSSEYCFTNNNFKGCCGFCKNQLYQNYFKVHLSNFKGTLLEHKWYAFIPGVNWILLYCDKTQIIDWNLFQMF